MLTVLKSGTVSRPLILPLVLTPHWVCVGQVRKDFIETLSTATDLHGSSPLCVSIRLVSPALSLNFFSAESLNLLCPATACSIGLERRGLTYCPTAVPITALQCPAMPCNALQCRVSLQLFFRFSFSFWF